MPKDPDPSCPWCHGKGYLRDWVPRPFGPGNVPMDTPCDCTYDEDEEDGQSPTA